MATVSAAILLTAVIRWIGIVVTPWIGTAVTPWIAAIPWIGAIRWIAAMGRAAVRTQRVAQPLRTA